MGMFANMTTDTLEKSTDSLGGNFDPVATDVYDAIIKVAYAGKSQRSNAQSITVHAALGEQEFRETIWITNGQGENFYKDKQDPTKKRPMPGFTTVNDLCLLATGQDLSEQDTEEKMVKIYNFEERKEVPTPVQVLTGLTNKEVKLGILRQIVDKQKQGDDGKYHNTGETRTENVIDKVFHAETGRTVNEYLQNVESSEFLDAWVKKNQGKDRNKAKGTGSNSGAGSSGSGHPGGAAKKSLFG